uniref:Uncharacterized protein n=1 Tax=Coccidioides posadasii RMSCC 3488 TaxID=454284 RepID=A0A0J6FDW8_COCPO|nr:hypothetical protein CPAG_04825 [Coccidioides posadasii RMSCC 3488]
MESLLRHDNEPLWMPHWPSPAVTGMLESFRYRFFMQDVQRWQDNRLENTPASFSLAARWDVKELRGFHMKSLVNLRVPDPDAIAPVFTTLAPTNEFPCRLDRTADSSRYLQAFAADEPGGLTCACLGALSATHQGLTGADCQTVNDKIHLSPTIRPPQPRQSTDCACLLFFSVSIRSTRIAPAAG